MLRFFFPYSGHPRDLHSFPTRRSSDLPEPEVAKPNPAPPKPAPAPVPNAKPQPPAKPVKAPTSPSTRPEPNRSEEHTSELQSRPHLVCRLLLEKKKKTYILDTTVTRRQ